MNKINSFILLAALAVSMVLASPVHQDMFQDAEEHLDDYEEISQMSLFPADDDETKNLPEEQKIFGDYCIKSRDQTMSWLNNKANQAASEAFNSLFDRLIMVGRDVVEKQLGATKENAEEIRNSVDEEAEDGEQEQLNVFQKMFRAVKNVLRATFDAAKKHAQEYAEEVVAQFSKKDLEIISKACALFTVQLKPELLSSFEQTRNGFVKANPALKDTVGGTSLNQLKCTTSRRIMTITKTCETFATLQAVVLPIIMRND